MREIILPGKNTERQMSESMVLAVFLTLAGGFQMRIPYNCRGKVFANADRKSSAIGPEPCTGKVWRSDALPDADPGIYAGSLCGPLGAPSLQGITESYTGARSYWQRKCFFCWGLG